MAQSCSSCILLACLEVVVSLLIHRLDHFCLICMTFMSTSCLSRKVTMTVVLVEMFFPHSTSV
jgi:hypothetical protein